MQKTARDVKKISGVQHKGHRGRADRMEVRIIGLTAQGKANGGIKDRPFLRSGDLQQQDIMCVVVRVKSFAVRRRHVNIALERRPHIAFQLATERCELFETLVRFLNHERCPRGEKLAGLNNVEGAIGASNLGYFQRVVQFAKVTVSLGSTVMSGSMSSSDIRAA